MDISFLFFEDFEALDVFGPVEVLSELGEASVHYVSRYGGPVRARQGFRVETEKASQVPPGGILLVPGGLGTRRLVNDEEFLGFLRQLCERADHVLCVCTGSALLAKAGVLDGMKATSNKRSFEWVMSTSSKVDWIREARWVADGKYYTSSGVSAGIDMAFGFVGDMFGEETAEKIAHNIEYALSRPETRG